MTAIERFNGQPIPTVHIVVQIMLSIIRPIRSNVLTASAVLIDRDCKHIISPLSVYEYRHAIQYVRECPSTLSAV